MDSPLESSAPLDVNPLLPEQLRQKGDVEKKLGGEHVVHPPSPGSSSPESSSVEHLLEEHVTPHPAPQGGPLGDEHRVKKEEAKTISEGRVEHAKGSVLPHLVPDTELLPAGQAIVEGRIRNVEHGLIPVFPIPGKGGGPFKILDRMKDLGVSEVRVAVMNRGAVEWARDWTLGVGKQEERPQMLSQAASISKNVTAGSKRA